MVCVKKRLGDLIRKTLMILLGIGLCIGPALAFYFIFPHSEPVASPSAPINPWLIVVLFPVIIPGVFFVGLLWVVLIGGLMSAFFLGLFILGLGLTDWRVAYYGTNKLEKLRAQNGGVLPEKIDDSLKSELAAASLILLLIGALHIGDMGSFCSQIRRSHRRRRNTIYMVHPSSLNRQQR